MAPLNTFWHKVQRWTTNCFSATPTGILALESCLPRVALLISQRQRPVAPRLVCSLPELNPATAPLHRSFPSHSAHRAHDSSRALTMGLLSVYLSLHWQTLRPGPPLRNHLPIDAVAHKTIPFTHGLSRMPMINSHLISSAPSALPRSRMENSYSALKKRVRESLLAEWPGLLPTPGYYHHLPALEPRPFIGLGKFIAGRIYQIRAWKSYLAAHLTWRSPNTDTSCPAVVLSPRRSNTPFSHAPPDRALAYAYSTVFLALVRTLPFGPPSHCSKGSPPSSASPPPDSHLRCFRQRYPLPRPHCPSHH